MNLEQFLGPVVTAILCLLLPGLPLVLELYHADNPNPKIPIWLFENRRCFYRAYLSVVIGLFAVAGGRMIFYWGW